MYEHYLDDLGLFEAIVAGGSLTAAALDRGHSKSVVSTRLQRLEQALGVQLLARTTRRMRLTEAGERLHRRARDIVAAADEAGREAREFGDAPSGRLRVAAPVSFGQRYLGTLVARFLAAYPRVQLSLALSDRRVDLIGEGHDVAVRVGALPDSSLRARKLMDARLRLVAAPAYLAAHGSPGRPADLVRHQCLHFSHHATGHVWQFGSGQQRVEVEVGGRLQSDSGDLLAQAAVAGLGIALLPDFIVDGPIARGELHALLDHRCRQSLPVHALFAPAPRLSRTLRLFLDALTDSLG